VGFLTASDFAREKFGENSPTFRMLERDADLFLRKSLVVNRFYDKLSELYKTYGLGEISRQETIEKKTELFAELQQACSAISPDPVSFNKCPAAMNNAGLAFDRTYTRNYPIMHELYGSLGKDTATLVTTLKRLLPAWPASGH
jgi:hypothetical protein